jgi:hypothetical protein
MCVCVKLSLIFDADHFTYNFVCRINRNSYMSMFQASGTCMTKRVTLYGFVNTSSKKRTPFHTWPWTWLAGFLEGMDLCRKYAFGKMLMIGSDPPFKLKGVWLFRGQEIPKFCHGLSTSSHWRARPCWMPSASSERSSASDQDGCDKELCRTWIQCRNGWCLFCCWKSLLVT